MTDRIAADPSATRAPTVIPDRSLPVATQDPARWDDAVLAARGQFLQSWRWGAFKERHGWTTERVQVQTTAGTGLAQVLFKQRGPLSFGYLPRGPVLSAADADLAQTLFAAVDRVCRRRRALGLIVEPDVPLPLSRQDLDAAFVAGPPHVQPVRTVKVPLLADDALIAQMHPKTRYNIRLAQRRGVKAVRVTPDHWNSSIFYDLLQDTAGRNAFGVHTAAYYADFLRLFGDCAVLLFAFIDEVPVAGLIAARYGEEGVYMYGASSTRHRAHAAGFLLQVEAMRWARSHGCSRYDLWGIPAEDPPSTETAGGDRLAGSKGDDWRGLYEFKVRFGGQIIAYPPTLERRYHPVLASLARRVVRSTG